VAEEPAAVAVDVAREAAEQAAEAVEEGSDGGSEGDGEDEGGVKPPTPRETPEAEAPKKYDGYGSPGWFGKRKD
jgi:hypothetical protein